VRCRAGIVGAVLRLALLVRLRYKRRRAILPLTASAPIYIRRQSSDDAISDIYLTELCRQALPMLVTSESACVNAVSPK